MMVTNLQNCIEASQLELYQKLAQCENVPGGKAVLAPLHARIHEVGAELNQELLVRNCLFFLSSFFRIF